MVVPYGYQVASSLKEILDLDSNNRNPRYNHKWEVEQKKIILIIIRLLRLMTY